MHPELRQDLLERVRDLQERLSEAEETLRALRSGEVDAVVASGPDGDQVYTLRGADEAYRVMVQGMAEGALALTTEGLILFSNEQFATIVGTPLERVIGSHIQDFAAPQDADMLAALLNGSAGRKTELRLKGAGEALITVYLSLEKVAFAGAESLCLIVTDLSEQKRSEEIVAAEKLARSILEQAAEAILVVDPEGRISRASRAAEQLAGVPVIQRDFDEVFRIALASGADYPFRELLSGTIHAQAIRNREVSGIAPGGRKMDLLLSAALLAGPDSKVLGCVINLTDITGRKRRERELKFQADILEATSEAVIAVDPQQRITFWNAGAERLYGLSKEDALGKDLSVSHRYFWLSPDQEEAANTVLKEKGTWSGENIHVRNDGTEIVVSSTVTAIKPEHGGGVFAVIRDITEKYKAGEILRKSEARERSRAAELEAIMEAVPVVVSIARDPECRNIVGNRTAYELLRVPYASNFSKSAPEAEKPNSWREMKNGKALAPEELPMQVAARSGRPVRDYEFDIVFDDGTSRCWLGNAQPLFDEAGHSRGAVGAFVDITERKIAERRLQDSEKLETIGRLAGGLAHDFNNLLVGVIGNATMAKETLLLDPETDELLDGVIASGEQLANLTRQMLAYSGKGRFVMEPLNLSRLVPEMSGLIQVSVPKKIRIKFELEPLLPMIEADRGQMKQILNNLILNAAEAIGANAGQISVRTGIQNVDEAYLRRHAFSAELSIGKYVYLEVQDTGCGMDAATMVKIFDPFFSTKFTGRGLGLAAVDGIVRGHKGAMNVTTAPGEGSCFRVMFPAIETTVATPRPGGQPAARAGAGTILVVDDEELIRELASKVLTHHGYDVLLANNGLEAIDCVKKHSGNIALVLLDLSMPGVSGRGVLPELRKFLPSVRVVVSSGYSEAEAVPLFEGQDISGFIQKPYSSTALAEKIKYALG